MENWLIVVIVIFLFVIMPAVQVFSDYIHSRLLKKAIIKLLELEKKIDDKIK